MTEQLYSEIGDDYDYTNTINITYPTIALINKCGIIGEIFDFDIDPFNCFVKTLRKCYRPSNKYSPTAFTAYDGWIIELKDEWFIVSFVLKIASKYSRKWYLCDQLDGLEQCLINFQDILKKNINLYEPN